MSVTEARAKLPEILDEVDAGREVTITRHGKPVAVVTRPDDAARRHRLRHVLEGAENVRREIEAARHIPLSEATPLAPGEADELVAWVRAGRDARG